ncbi:MAG: hypothetical protein ABIL40_09460 [candidate division WOR-3 bacterium]
MIFLILTFIFANATDFGRIILTNRDSSGFRRCPQNDTPDCHPFTLFKVTSDSEQGEDEESNSIYRCEGINAEINNFYTATTNWHGNKNSDTTFSRIVFKRAKAITYMFSFPSISHPGGIFSAKKYHFLPNLKSLGIPHIWKMIEQDRWEMYFENLQRDRSIYEYYKSSQK